MPRKVMVSPVHGPVRQVPQSPLKAAPFNALPKEDSYPQLDKTQAQNTLLSCYDKGMLTDRKSAIGVLMKRPFHVRLVRVLPFIDYLNSGRLCRV